MNFYLNVNKAAFMGNCTACGGNWAAMLLSGIKKSLPELFKAMPDVSYDFNTIGQLVNVVCTDDQTTLDTLQDAFSTDTFTQEDREYWVECLQRSNEQGLSDRDTKMMAFLWMFKYLAIKYDDKAVRPAVEYLTNFEKYARGDANNVKIAKQFLMEYLASWSERIDRDLIEEDLLDDDDFINEVNRAKSREEIYTLVEVYTDNLIEDRGIAEYAVDLF